MTESFFDTPARAPGEVTTADRFDVPRDQYGRRMLPDSAGMAVAWTGITTMARTLEDEYNLQRWKLRQAMWGQAHRPDLIAVAGAASKTDKKTLDQVAEAAVAAASDHKADLGTALHNILARVDAGLALADVPEYFHPMVAAYQAQLEQHKVTILPDYIERAVVSNLYCVDGIGDRWVQLSDGSIVYMDIKTGDDPGRYPHKPTIQLAICANADAAIDHTTGLQVPLPPVETAFALVMHVDPLAGTARLLRNDDILAGWAAVRLAYEVRQWRKRDIVFHPYISEINWAPKPPVLPEVTHVPAAQSLPDTNGHATPAAPIDVTHLRSAHDFVAAEPVTQHPGVDPVAAKLDAQRRVEDILAVRKNDKAALQRWAQSLGCTDLNHHRKWLAEEIVKRDPTGVDVEQPGAAVTADSNGAVVVDPDVALVIAAINAAPSIEALRSIHTNWTAAKGPESWAGDVLAAGHRRMTEIRMSEAATR